MRLSNDEGCEKIKEIMKVFRVSKNIKWSGCLVNQFKVT